MTQLTFTLPTIGDPNSTEDVDVRTALSDIKTVVNGNLDTANLSGSAGVTYAQLAADVLSSIQAILIPPGTILSTGVSAAPTGYLLCQGQAISRTTYSALFVAISTTYGVGDGVNTFNLPDLQGRAPVGLGTHADVNALADSDGVSTVSSRTPKHIHTVASHNHGIFFNTGAPSNAPSRQYGSGGTFSGIPDDAHVHLVSGNTDSQTPATGTPSTGGSFVVVNFMIKT